MRHLPCDDSWFIFGAGSGGIEVLNTLDSSVRIAAFVDNNIHLHGKTIQGVPIVPPNHLLSKPQPHVLIASMYAAAIYDQMLQMRIPGADIHTIRVDPTRNCIAKDLRAVGLPTRELTGFPRTYKMQYQPPNSHG